MNLQGSSHCEAWLSPWQSLCRSFSPRRLSALPYRQSQLFSFRSCSGIARSYQPIGSCRARSRHRCRFGRACTSLAERMGHIRFPSTNRESSGTNATPHKPLSRVLRNDGIYWYSGFRTLKACRAKLGISAYYPRTASDNCIRNLYGGQSLTTRMLRLSRCRNRICSTIARFRAYRSLGTCEERRASRTACQLSQKKHPLKEPAPP